MRKSIKAFVALAAYAALIVVPSSASAMFLTHPTGTLALPGSGFIATNVGTAKFTLPTGGAIECSSTKMTGKVTVNEKEIIQWLVETVQLTGTEFGGACTSGLGRYTFTPKKLPWCITSGGGLGLDNFEIRSGKCGENGAMTFVMDGPNNVECKYEQAGVKGTVTTDVSGQDAVLDITESQFTGEAGNAITCPTSLKFDASLTLETDSTKAEPFYIS